MERPAETVFFGEMSVDSHVTGRHQSHENLRLVAAVWENVNNQVSTAERASNSMSFRC